MPNEPRVYRHSVFEIILTVMVWGILVSASFIALTRDTMFIFLPLEFLLLLIAVLTILPLTITTTVSDSEISVQNIFGATSLRWSEIDHVSGKGNLIKLHNFDADVTVKPSPQLPGYEEIIEWIGTKRPDLFNMPDGEEMSRNSLTLALIIFAIILITGIAMFSVIQTKQWLFAVFVLFVGVAISIILLSAPQSITRQGKSLLLKYIFREKTLLADEIESVQLVSQRTRNGKTYHIRINLTGGKGGMRIAGLEPSLPIVYLRLKNWHTGMKPSRN